MYLVRYLNFTFTAMLVRPRGSRTTGLLILGFLGLTVIISWHLNNHEPDRTRSTPTFQSDFYDLNAVSQSPMIFIGGSQRSGTSLVRAILDVHDEISCGTELLFLYTILEMNHKLDSRGSEGFKISRVQNATMLYMHSAMSRELAEHERPCAKDPFILHYMSYLHKLFPRAKFLYIVRDPRAQVTSNLRYIRKTPNLLNREVFIIRWNDFNTKFHAQCVEVGPESCLMVHYERLILDFNRTMREIVRFLGITWTDDFLHHEDFVGSRIKVADVEWSTPQIKQARYVESLTDWANRTTYPSQILEKAKIASTLGYDLSVISHAYLVKNHERA